MTNKQLLLCGGLAGHLAHVHEDLGLKFSDITKILRSAADGKLENVSEKIDGQNFFFTYNSLDNTLRFARNKGNIKTGGMTGADVAAKWQDKPAVAKAFTDAYNVMKMALDGLDLRTKAKIFGNGGIIWYSAEVVSTANPNVINYDRNAIVFHESGNAYDANGNPVDNIDASSNFQALVNSVSSLQSRVAEKTDWSIYGPLLLQLKRLSDKKPLQIAEQQLNKLMSVYKLSPSSSLANFAEKYIEHNILSSAEYPGTPKQKNALVKIIVGDENSGIKEKKDKLKTIYTDPNEFAAVAPLVNLAPKLIGKALSSIESVITAFSIEMLKGVHSQIALHPDEATNKIKNELKAVISQIEASNDEHAMELLSRHLGRLRSIDNVTSSLEGVVFKYNGKAYKLVGAFSPINQLLGMMRYSR
jgi:hypothetical protein